MFTDYHIVEADSTPDLISRVKIRLDKGWKVSGGVEKVDGKFIQPMTLTIKAPVKDYVLVTGSNPETLQKEVNSMLQQGWQLHDGPTAYTTSEGRTIGDIAVYGIAQAMVKY